MYESSNYSGNILLWILFNGFMVVALSTLFEYLMFYAHDILIKSIFQIFGILIISTFLEYIFQYKILKNKCQISKIIYNSVFIALLFYMIIINTDFSTWIFILPVISMIVLFIRYNDYLSFRRRFNR